MIEAVESSESAQRDGQSAQRNIFAIGASAGGVETLSTLIGCLPANFPGAIFVVIHIAPTAKSVLPAILERRGLLRAIHPRDGDRIEPSVVYIAPPDHHLVVERDRVRVTRGASENGSRPAVDVLFRSAAAAYGARVTGIVLSGNLDDGTAGLVSIQRCGGTTVVQDPEEALFPGMVQSALANVDVDATLSIDGIARLMVKSATDMVSDEQCDTAGALKLEVEMAKLDPQRITIENHPGTPSGFTCPDCHGALWELSDGELVRYRCRVGHAYSPDTLLALESTAVENALWTAYRALEENAALARRMQRRAAAREQDNLARRFSAQVADLESRAEVIREVLTANRAEVTESAEELGPT